MTSKQTPINSGFDNSTTATQALAGKDLHGMTAIVTGGYPWAVDTEYAERLWALSERLSGVTL